MSYKDLPPKFMFNMNASLVFGVLSVASFLLSWDYMGWFLLGAFVGQLLKAQWLLFFDDTMNRVQYLPVGGGNYVYYITRNDGAKAAPWTFKSFMNMTSYPWLKGKGRTFRIPRGLTFQIGTARKVYLTEGDDGLSKALGAHPLDMPVEEIRDLEPARLVKTESSNGN
jgi:hypothetical protein